MSFIVLLLLTKNNVFLTSFKFIHFLTKLTSMLLKDIPSACRAAFTPTTHAALIAVSVVYHFSLVSHPSWTYPGE